LEFIQKLLYEDIIEHSGLMDKRFPYEATPCRGRRQRPFDSTQPNIISHCHKSLDAERRIARYNEKIVHLLSYNRKCKFKGDAK